MVSSKAATVKEYLDELPAERRAVVSAVRDVILKNLPEGYEETMNWGMICYEIPLSRYPNTYNKQPLGCAALAAQKNYYAVYLSALYCGTNDEFNEDWLRKEFDKAGKKLDCGKSCVRFKKLEDLPLDVIGAAIRIASPDEYIRAYEETRKSGAVGKRKIN
ncbi:MAG: hypothetical protein C0469_05745 [Cyanobacteria bacterium DS2.3.42]|nr:hypothetical protein [Cyanobacteria bacterium DS2.3.42]